MPKFLTQEDIAQEADDSDDDDDVDDAYIPKVPAQEQSNRIKYDKKRYSRAPKQCLGGIWCCRSYLEEVRTSVVRIYQ